MQALVEYSWPGNVRELRNLVESMVVLSHGREIGPSDIPREMRRGGGADRRLPVLWGRLSKRHGREGAEGRELEFIVRSLVELKLNVEELRLRTEQLGAAVASRGDGALGGGDGTATDRSGSVLGGGAARAALSSGVSPEDSTERRVTGAIVSAIEPPSAAPPPNIVTVRPGMTMVEIERASIEAALRETRGNRRKAAEMLGIGERTLYRKLREYEIPDEPGASPRGDLEGGGGGMAEAVRGR